MRLNFDPIFKGSNIDMISGGVFLPFLLQFVLGIN